MLILKLSFIAMIAIFIISQKTFAYETSYCDFKNGIINKPPDILFSGVIKMMTSSKLRALNGQLLKTPLGCTSEDVIFKVEKMWKGEKQKEVLISIPENYRCHNQENTFQNEEGMRYLVYAYKNKTKSKINNKEIYHTKYCYIRNSDFLDTIENIKSLGKPKYNFDYQISKKISKQKAIEIAIKASKIMDIPKDVNPIIEETNMTFIVIFPTNLPKGTLGSDYYTKIIIDKETSKILSLLVAS